MEGKEKKYRAEVFGCWVPVYAASLDEALEKAELEYGKIHVKRVKEDRHDTN